MRKKRAPIEDLNAHRLARLDRWGARLSWVPFVGAAVLFPALFVAVLVESETVVAWATLGVTVGFAVTVLGMVGSWVVALLRLFERAIQRTERWLGDDDEPMRKDKRKRP